MKDWFHPGAPDRRFHGMDADDEAPDSDTPHTIEHDVLVHFRLSNRALGVAEERAALEELGEQIGDAVAAAAVGEYDGSELGAGECTLFFAGADADRLFAVLQPLVHRHPLGRGATATLQRGTAEPVRRSV